MSMQLQRSMAAVPVCVPVLRSAIAAFARKAGVAEPLLSSVKLAVGEAVTNAVLHAYVGRRTGQVHVAARIENDFLHVEVSDDGSGMMPRLDSPGLGVGLPFIVDTADALDISSSPRGGTQLLMKFEFTLPRSAAPECGLSPSRPHV